MDILKRELGDIFSCRVCLHDHDQFWLDKRARQTAGLARSTFTCD